MRTFQDDFLNASQAESIREWEGFTRINNEINSLGDKCLNS